VKLEKLLRNRLKMRFIVSKDTLHRLTPRSSTENKATLSEVSLVPDALSRYILNWHLGLDFYTCLVRLDAYDPNDF